MTSRCLQGRLAIGLAAVMALPVWAKGAPQVASELPDAVRAARKSVVIVITRTALPLRPREAATSYNTGLLVTKDGHVLTSLLCVGGSRSVAVRTHDGRTADAQVVALDQPSGFALLRAELTATGPAQFAAKRPQPMQSIATPYVACRSGNDPEIRFSQGVASITSASLRISGRMWPDLIVADLPLAPGVAAGPVFDEAGALAGVVLGVRTTMDGRAWSYVLPGERLKPILAELVAGKTRRQGWFGAAVAHTAGKEGLVLCGVIENGPAYAAGLRARDILLVVGGKAITEPEVFQSAVANLRPGSKAAVRYLRGSTIEEATIDVGVRPLLISRVSPRYVPGLRPYSAGPQADAAAFAAYEVELRRLQDQNRRLVDQVRRLDGMLKQLEMKMQENSRQEQPVP